MTQGKAACFLSIGFYLKCKVGCHDEVADKANQIAHRIGSSFVEVPQQQVIYAILNAGGNHSDNAETDDFSQSLTVFHSSISAFHCLIILSVLKFLAMSMASADFSFQLIMVATPILRDKSSTSPFLKYMPKSPIIS